MIIVKNVNVNIKLFFHCFLYVTCTISIAETSSVTGSTVSTFIQSCSPVISVGLEITVNNSSSIHLLILLSHLKIRIVIKAKLF